MAESTQTDEKQETAETSTEVKEETVEVPEKSEEEEVEVNPLLVNLKARVSELSEDKNRLQNLLNQFVTQGPAATGQQVVDQDEGDIDPAVSRKLNRALQAQAQQYQQMMGGVMEELDKVAILQSPLASLYNENASEVESFRKEKSAFGQYFKREEALAVLLAKKGVLQKAMNPIKKTTVVKQTIKPAGETSKAGSVKESTGTEPTLEERLKGKAF